MDNSWSHSEGTAVEVIREFEAKLGDNGDPFGAAEDYLSGAECVIGEERPIEHLMKFVVLHHARSVIVPIRQFMRNGPLDSTTWETIIGQRSEDARHRYSKCGFQVTVFPSDIAIPLGAIPVYDAEDWSGRAPGTAEFMMSLTPRTMICGSPELPQGHVEVRPGTTDQETPIIVQLGGVPTEFTTPYLICKPSALEPTSDTTLHQVEGGNWHWYAIRERIDLCGTSAPDELRADWHRRTRRHSRDQGIHGTTTRPVKQRLQATMAQDARKIQKDLDDLDVDVCSCVHYRRNHDDSVAASWKAIMPQVICGEVRRQRNIASGGRRVRSPQERKAQTTSARDQNPQSR
ncbi:MAG: hypothetical protein OXH54_01125 [Acidimicrobiaceae bacterium]|nr:hypothetical protein [Acidimicrobiaceae bacterium]